MQLQGGSFRDQGFEPLVEGFDFRLWALGVEGLEKKLVPFLEMGVWICLFGV